MRCFTGSMSVWANTPRFRISNTSAARGTAASIISTPRGSRGRRSTRTLAASDGAFCHLAALGLPGRPPRARHLRSQLEHTPVRHFSGNFWWARSSYVRRLDPLRSFLRDVGRQTHDRRLGCELWSGSHPEVRAMCLHHSGVNHYHELYPRSRYAQLREVTGMTAIPSHLRGEPEPTRFRICWSRSALFARSPCWTRRT